MWFRFRPEREKGGKTVVSPVHTWKSWRGISCARRMTTKSPQVRWWWRRKRNVTRLEQRRSEAAHFLHTLQHSPQPGLAKHCADRHRGGAGLISITEYLHRDGPAPPQTVFSHAGKIFQHLVPARPRKWYPRNDRYNPAAAPVVLFRATSSFYLPIQENIEVMRPVESCYRIHGNDYTSRLVKLQGSIMFKRLLTGPYMYTIWAKT